LAAAAAMAMASDAVIQVLFVQKAQYAAKDDDGDARGADDDDDVDHERRRVQGRRNYYGLRSRPTSSALRERTLQTCIVLLLLHAFLRRRRNRSAERTGVPYAGRDSLTQ
jgi:hypothetical protein